MSESTFAYDAFLSYSSKDRPIVRELAERLKADGVRVWLDEWEIKPGDSIPRKVEEGLENSRVLILCMSENAFGSDWATLESYTFRFRDPLNKERRFLPLRLDDAYIKGSLTQFHYLSWKPDSRGASYMSLLEACRTLVPPAVIEKSPGNKHLEKLIKLSYRNPRIYSYAFRRYDKIAISGSDDSTVRVWNVETGKCLQVMKRHKHCILSVSLSPDGKLALSGSDDNTMRVWNIETGECLQVMKGHDERILSVSWSPDGKLALSGDNEGKIRIWDLSSFVGAEKATFAIPGQTQYTNAKVLLVGESGAGKTGISKVLAGQEWEASDSTVGAWATHWKLPVAPENGLEREIWLWDFGGQADQGLIHQLYMDETALAVLVFDGQKEDLFETLGQWDRDICRASQKEFNKLLVAGRVDAGGLRTSRQQMENFAKERGFDSFLESSAKSGVGCQELREAILNGIQWENIPWRTSPTLFKRLKEEIVVLKDQGHVLLRFNELREVLMLRMTSETERFTDSELKAVIGLLAGPGAVWELKFGSWVLLQPERINAYAQAVIQTLRDDPHERGCLLEEKVLSGDLKYSASVPRLPQEEERMVLLAMHQALLERALCLRESTDSGNLLVFPSYYRRERPELTGHPAVQVSYRFNGFLDDVYATLVVRLHHTSMVDKDQLWRYAADFKTLTGKHLGIKLNRLGEGAGELSVYFDPEIPMQERIIFGKYVHEHVMHKGRDVVRLRHYVCPHCGTPSGNRAIAMERINTWLESGGKDAKKPTLLCVKCEDRFDLWDEMEQYFASDEARQKVRHMQEESAIVLDAESKERALVGDVISTVAVAAQLSREFNVSDHGIDMEIEFKTDEYEATGKKLYLQLKSGDSYIKQQRGGKEVYRFKEQRHVRYWINQPCPVMLVIRNSEGEVRWMEVSSVLKELSANGTKPVKQIEFVGERLDVMSVRRWRDKVLNGQVP